MENVNTIMKRLLSENVRIPGLIENSELICAYGVARNVSIRKRLLWDMRVNTEKKEGSRMINYIAWADEYVDKAQNLLKVIEKKKRMVETASADEKHMLNADITRLRNIYYECMLTAKHLRERGEKYNDA